MTGKAPWAPVPIHSRRAFHGIFSAAVRGVCPNSSRRGFEGAFLTKVGKRYYLACAEFIQGDYHCMIAQADSIYGPYGPRYLAIPHGGHNMLFKDRDGQWRATFFGNDAHAPFRERPGIMRVAFDQEGRVHPL